MAKLVINESTLDAMGDALRAHFGENIKEGIVSTQEGSPRVINTPNYVEYGESYTNGEYMAGDQLFVQTLQVHGASKLVLDLSYATDTFDYIWVAPGARKQVDENSGQLLQHSMNYGDAYCSLCGGLNITDTGIGRVVYKELDGSIDIGDKPVGNASLHVCQDCGALGFTYWENYSGLFDYGIMDASGYTTIFPMPSFPKRVMESFTFEGDTFTFACKILTRTSITGYYGNLYAYDADGNEMTSFEMTIGRVPNTYSPAEMVEAIGKLNNYPDAKEVPF